MIQGASRPKIGMYPSISTATFFVRGAARSGAPRRFQGSACHHRPSEISSRWFNLHILVN
eukprot:1393780-Amorphochlora_amoeboformis.AAC.1